MNGIISVLFAYRSDTNTNSDDHRAHATTPRVTQAEIQTIFARELGVRL